MNLKHFMIGPDDNIEVCLYSKPAEFNQTAFIQAACIALHVPVALTWPHATLARVDHN